MIYRASEILDLKVEATNGRIGKVNDLFFDDVEFKVRHVVVDVGSWIAERQVLLAPQAMARIDLIDGCILTDLSREKVEDSPPVQTDLPVSRRYEGFLFEHYGWRPYWIYPAGLAISEIHSPMREAMTEQDESSEAKPTRVDAEETRLRSWRDVVGYGVHATDGMVGHVDELLLSEDDWSIVGLVINTGRWWPHHDVVIDVQCVKSVSWGEEYFEVALTTKEVRASEPFRSELLQDWTLDHSNAPWRRDRGIRHNESSGLRS